MGEEKKNEIIKFDKKREDTKERTIGKCKGGASICR